MRTTAARTVTAGARERPGLSDAFPTRHLLLALLIATVAVGLWLPGGLTVLTAEQELVLVAGSATLVALAALHLATGLPEGVRGIARWRIGPWYLLWSMLTFAIAPLTWLLPENTAANRIEIASVTTAITLFAVSLLPWIAGYYAGVPRAVRGLAHRGLALLLRGTVTTVRGGAMPWVLYGIGTAARILSVGLTGRFGYVGDPSELVTRAGAADHLLGLVATLSLFAIAAAAYRAFSPTIRGGQTTLWTLVAVEAVIGALAGGKQYLLLSVLAVLIPYSVHRGRISLRILLAGAVVFLWIAVPFNSAYRQVVRSDESTLAPAAAFTAAPAVVREAVTEKSVVTVMADSTIQMLTRVRMIDSVAITVQRTPEMIPYRSPAEFATAPVVGLIPRAIWPDKPVLTPGYDFSREYYGTPDNMYTSVGVTPLGDLYRHGGPITVLAGMLLLGMGARLFDTLIQPESDPRAIFFLLAFMPTLLRADIYSMIVSVPSSLLLAVVGARLVCRVAPRTKVSL